jgi:S1-C subfamily serine protease
MIRLVPLSLAFLVLNFGAAAQPAQNPEEAAVFIEVSIESLDPTTNQPRLTKVGEGSGFLIHKDGWIITAAHVTAVEVPATARLVMTGSVRSRYATKFPLEMPPRGVVTSDAALLRFPARRELSLPLRRKASGYSKRATDCCDRVSAWL